MDPIDNTPRQTSSNAVRVIGILVVAALVIAVVLLALGVVNFEQSGWF